MLVKELIVFIFLLYYCDAFIYDLYKCYPNISTTWDVFATKDFQDSFAETQYSHELEHCCKEIKLVSNSGAEDFQSDKLGTYKLVREFNGRFAFKHALDNWYLYRADNGWTVGPTLGALDGAIFHSDKAECVEKLSRNWQYWNGDYWSLDDKSLSARCLGPRLAKTKKAVPSSLQQCCTEIVLTARGRAAEYHIDELGHYFYTSIVNGKLAFKHESGVWYLYLASNGWTVGPKLAMLDGGIFHDQQAKCVEKLTKKWQYWDGHKWTLDDPTLTVQCAKKETLEDSEEKRIPLNLRTCCRKVAVLSTETASEFHAKEMGVYEFVSISNNKLAFKHESYDWYLFMASNGWTIGPKLGKQDGGIFHDRKAKCVEHLTKNWQFWNGKIWTLEDKTLHVECFNENENKKGKYRQSIIPSNLASCCKTIELVSTGKATKLHSPELGIYNFVSLSNNRLAYQHEDEEWYIYQASNGWTVGQTLGAQDGGIFNDNKVKCVETLGAKWQYFDGNNWKLDDLTLRVNCASEGDDEDRTDDDEVKIPAEVSRCCKEVILTGTEGVSKLHSQELGLYKFIDINNNRLAYKHHFRDFYLFLADNGWTVGPILGALDGSIFHDSKTKCVEKITKNWQYYNGVKWSLDDKTLRVICATEAVKRDYIAKQKEKLEEMKRIGPGEKGEAVELGEVDEETQAEIDAMYKRHAFNEYVSEMISFNRSLEDKRHEWCHKEEYLPIDELPDTSIVVIFFNEAWSTLIRTLHTIINRSPSQLVKEIIFIDDFSDLELHPHLGSKLEEYLKDFEKVSIHRNKERQGVIRARMVGARLAKGKTLTFLDSHIECNDGWLVPLLDRIARNRKAIVCPVIDNIAEKNFQYIFVEMEAMIYGSFNWKMEFDWIPVSQKENDRRSHLWAPIQSPTLSGGLFTVDKSWFEELGYFDEGMEIWGGENLELSFKTWMCGGIIEILPCSRVGHVFRTWTPYPWKSGLDVLKHNSVRLAEVWMDDYKYLYYARLGTNADSLVDLLGDYGDISSRVELRKKLKCKNFDWYLKNILPEVPRYELQGAGSIKNAAYGLCLDGNDDFKHTRSEVKAKSCHNTGGDQFWYFLRNGYIQRDVQCIGKSAEAEDDGKELVIVGCSVDNTFEYDSKTNLIRHEKTGLCLAIEDNDGRVLFQECDSSDEQLWEFIYFKASGLKYSDMTF